jgi:hypothetical protein
VPATATATVPAGVQSTFPASSAALPGVTNPTLSSSRLAPAPTMPFTVPPHYAGTAVQLEPLQGNTPHMVSTSIEGYAALSSTLSTWMVGNAASMVAAPVQSNTPKLLPPTKPLNATPIIVTRLAEEGVFLSSGVDQTLLASVDMTTTGRGSKPALHIRCDCAFQGLTGQACTEPTKLVALVDILKKCYGGTHLARTTVLNCSCNPVVVKCNRVKDAYKRGEPYLLPCGDTCCSRCR